MRGFLACGLAVVSLMTAACGDDGDEPAQEDGIAVSTAAPTASQSIDEAVAELNRVVSEQDCDGLVALTYSTMRGNAEGTGVAEAGEPVRPEECKDNGAGPLLQELEGASFEESENYADVGAVTVGSTARPVEGYDAWSVIWLADRDGQWRSIGYIPTDPQFEEDLPASVDLEGVAERLVAAVESGDCDDAQEWMAEQTRFGPTAKEACAKITGGSTFAPAVKSGEEPVLEELGATRDLALVGADLGEVYYAVYLATPPIAPNEPVQDEILVQDVVRMSDVEETE